MQWWVDSSALEGPALAVAWEDSCPAPAEPAQGLALLLGLALTLEDSYPALPGLGLALAPGQGSCPAPVDPALLCPAGPAHSS